MKTKKKIKRPPCITCGAKGDESCRSPITGKVLSSTSHPGRKIIIEITNEYVR